MKYRADVWLCILKKGDYGGKESCANSRRSVRDRWREIYKLFLPIVSRIYLTLVHTEVNGDTFFPDIPKEEWKEVGHEYHDGDPAYSFIVLNRT